MNRFLALIFIISISLCSNRSLAQIKVLFDATKAETAGSADWVIDADASKAGVQRFPTPAQSTVTATTPETYWAGALSSWAIDCVNKGYQVESLPSSGKITYGDKTNVQDLSNYKVYVVCEPNVLFKASEKTAILNFVNNGGGLFMISDHAGADRNNDGKDATQIWNDFSNNNGSVKNPFGINFDTTNPNKKLYPSDITEVSTNVTPINNPITNGTYGTVKKFSYSDGTTMVLDTVANNTVKGVIFANESTNILSGAMVVYARYGKGKIVATGDSSPSDDGTGFTNSGLYKSYSGDSKVGDNHRYLFMNSTIWLATTDTVLPISFLNVDCKNKSGVTIIQWQSNSSTKTTTTYQIERSANRKYFTALASVNSAKSLSDGTSNYEYSIPEVINYPIYYRIKATDMGDITYSKTLTVAPSTTSHQINIYPNPTSASSGSNFTISGLITGSIISVTDMRGIKYFETKATNSTITLNTNRIGGQKLTQGVYIIMIKEFGIGNISTNRLVINK